MGLPEGFLNTMLDRYVDILETISGLGAEPLIIAEPTALPRVYCFVSRLVPSRTRYGNDYISYEITVTMRLITGGVGSGSIGEKEQDANRLGLQMVDVFALRYQLEDPVTNEALDFLTPDIAERVVSFNGPTQFNYGNAATPKLFVGANLLDEVRLLTKRK
jgi:hypothetical protein